MTQNMAHTAVNPVVWLAWVGAGVTGVAFAASDLVHREYDPVAEVVSRYVNGPYGWLVTVGIAGIVVAVAGLATLVGKGRARWLFGGAAASLTLCVVFPADPPGMWHAPSVSESVHGFAAWAGLSLLFAGIVVFTRAGGMPSRALTWCAVVAGGSLVLFVVCLVDRMALTHSAPIGLVERVLLAADLVWVVLAAAVGRRGAW
ncbi:DUF998 domain-containing protein [Actinocorallia sp. A-T 12471]|uniref:DUF998 domain-containing protein n=1 Tax=Actinocorallia sp. A-T 12471 TaxID=3089813 RepID=UPI0029D0A947|nr:DUF998 domain-containing protein [Actinocorallia sp. A-T 12471]MDX6738916.1 DUF998 domain-containing protein [Actinocorallia sp. A-T 12471]